MTLIAALEALHVGPDERLVIRLIPSRFVDLDDVSFEAMRDDLLLALEEIGLSRRVLVLFAEPEAIEIAVVESVQKEGGWEESDVPVVWDEAS